MRRCFSGSLLVLSLSGFGCGESDGMTVQEDSAALLQSQRTIPPKHTHYRAPEEIVGFKLVGRFAAPTGPAAESVAVSPDGQIAVFTNGVLNTVEFLDLRRPDAPQHRATVDVRDVVGHPGAGSVSSVAVTPNGRYAIATVIDAFDPAAAHPGALAFIDMNRPELGVVAVVQLGVGPDALDITPDGRQAVVAIEDESSPDRPGSVQIVTLNDSAPETSAVKTLALSPDVGNARHDPEPEYVDISRDGKRALVSLQENNALAVIDLVKPRVERYLDAGFVSRPVDLDDDGEIRLDQPFRGRREPDAVCWLADGEHFVTANEGDTDADDDAYSGGRGFTVMSRRGKVVYEGGGALDELAVRMGQYPDSRSDARGIEVEGCGVDTFGKREYAFLLGERNSSLGVVDVSVPHRPRVVQMLPAPFRPEGVVTVPQRRLVIVTGEGPNDGGASDAVLGGGLWLYEGVTRADWVQTYPEDVLQAESKFAGFGAISAAAWNGVEGQLVTTPDAAFTRQRLWFFEEDARAGRMRLVHELFLSDSSGAPLTDYDPEGLAANPEGGYVIASEGERGNGGSPRDACTTGADRTEKDRNRLLFLDWDGKLSAKYGGGDGIVDLPCAARGEPNGLDWSRVGEDGFEGAAVVDTRPHERGGLRVYVALQRPLSGNVDPAGLTRIGEYVVDSDRWNFYFYPLEANLAGSRGSIMLSEIAHLGGDRFAVLERDQRRSGSAVIKRLYTVELSSGTPNLAGDPLDKVLAVDLLQTPFRFDFEKLEGLAVTPRGAFVVNDNDGGEEATFFYRVALSARASSLR